MSNETQREPTKILVIEDELAIRKLLRASFTPDEAVIIEAENGEDGILRAAKSNPDVVLLDLGLPDVDGQEVCRRLREWTDVPIIVLSARGQERDKVEALDNGANDYMTKPFSVAELQARIRVTLRHRSKQTSAHVDPVFENGGLRVDIALRQVTKDGVEIKLTPNEYKLLAMLVKHSGMVLTHRQMLLEVWGPAYLEELHYLRVYMAQLRQKIESDPARPKWITTETGVGYRLRSVDD